MWKIDCSATALPCLANSFLEAYPEGKKKMFDTKTDDYIHKFLKELEPSVEYKLEHCMVLRFHGSLLSAKKNEESKEGGDNSTASLICPFMLE